MSINGSSYFCCCFFCTVYACYAAPCLSQEYASIDELEQATLAYRAKTANSGKAVIATTTDRLGVVESSKFHVVSDGAKMRVTQLVKFESESDYRVVDNAATDEISFYEEVGIYGQKSDTKGYFHRRRLVELEEDVRDRLQLFHLRDIGQSTAEVRLYRIYSMTEMIGRGDVKTQSWSKRRDTSGVIYTVINELMNGVTYTIDIAANKGPSIIHAKGFSSNGAGLYESEITVELALVDGLWFPSKLVVEHLRNGEQRLKQVANISVLSLGKVDSTEFSWAGIDPPVGTELRDASRGSIEYTIWDGNKAVDRSLFFAPVTRSRGLRVVLLTALVLAIVAFACYTYAKRNSN